ncbi:MAG: hypothetical protein ACMG6S_34585, partial [Byssovorax sp.]
MAEDPRVGVGSLGVRRADTGARTLLVCASLLLASCAEGARGRVQSVPSARGFPERLRGTVQRFEEQGFDYASTQRSTFVLALRGDGTGRAVRTKHGVDVAGADVHKSDERVEFDATARWEGSLLGVTLVPRQPGPAQGAPIVLRCERWRPGTSASRSTDATDPTLPGVEWTCALPRDPLFLLGRVALQHVPREGEFLLLGESHAVETEERVEQSARSVV